MKVTLSELQTRLAIKDVSGKFAGTLGELGIIDSGDPITAYHVAYHIHAYGEDIRLEGTVQTELMLVCDRCLNDVPLAVSGQFDTVISTSDELESDNDLTVFSHKGDHEVIDLAETFCEAVNLAKPQKVLCRNECKGLCATCGADRNKADCTCADEAVDDRWAPLLKIRDKLKS